MPANLENSAVATGLEKVIFHSNSKESESEVTQSCLTLCDPRDCSPPGSSVHGIFQARVLEWVAISFSNAWKWKVKVKSLQSCPTLWDPMDCSLQGLSAHGTFQARVLEWVAIAFSQKNAHYPTIALISHTSKVMLKILQAKPQQYVNYELLDVQAGFRKGRGIRDQIANIHWIIEKAREFQKNNHFCFIDSPKAFNCVDNKKTVENSWIDGKTRPPYLPPV